MTMVGWWRERMSRREWERETEFLDLPDECFIEGCVSIDLDDDPIRLTDGTDHKCCVTHASAIRRITEYHRPVSNM